MRRHLVKGAGCGGDSALANERDGPAQNALQLLETWMTSYGQDVIHLAYAYVKNYHQAQDIAQDVFLRAFTKMESFRGESSARTWLLSITANRCKDHLRSWSMRHEVAEDNGFQREVALANTERDVEEQLLRDELWNAVHQLPVKYREAVILYYLQELTSAEVALVVGTTEQTVRTRLHRARLMLQERLERKEMRDDSV